ncbi:scavenger receptor cysteine-rich domain-containing protein DMBT1-like [Asterias amurensis]|uniref:scavenger receptor cysteine-rich domain-containing protein DMBT1-like n=1 Tax=Asterias amurensis TaxID=7602 RepID=UPI003AB367F4
MWRFHCKSKLQLSLLIFCFILFSTFSRILVTGSNEGVKVRLVNGQTPYEGRLEVNYQGLWGTVCSSLWTIKNANVVCRQLGYPLATQSWKFGKGTGPILLSGVSCHGDELSIDQCDHSGWFVHTCNHQLDIGVSCGLTVLPAVRLVNGTTTHEGRVEVYFKCQWGTICDSIWGLKEADTVCRQLGYPSASHAWSAAHFGQGSLPIILNQVACNGNESSLVECNHDGWFNNQYCKHDQDAGVTCETSFLSNVLVRLVNGSTPYEGRVEVYQEDIWGTICGDNWDLTDAQVICRQLGYPAATRAWQNSHFGQGERLTLWSNVTCDGNESSIAECGYSSWMSQTFSDAGVAAVRCGEKHLMIEETEKIPVRLVNGAGPHEGRVEIFHKCFWGTLSSNGLEFKEANVICRQLGFPSADIGSSLGNFGRGTGPVLLTHMICNGDETSIDQCDRREWFENARGLKHDRDLEVICNVEPQLPPSVRLVGGNTPDEGRVEIYHKCYWGTIYSNIWTLREADVICRQLGYPSATHAWGRAHFGRGTGLLWLNVEGCNGSESNIIQCNHQGWLSETFTHSGDVGVTCSRRIGLNSPSQIRLVNGTSPYEGRLEVYYKDQWGAVCNKGWSMLESSVICRQLQYPPATLAWQGAHFGQGQGRILLDNVTCIGNETSIDQCYYSDWSSDNCSHDEVVGVTCGEVSQALDLQNISSHVNSSQGAVRLAGGQTPNEGRVEIFYKCSWGKICNLVWSIRAADVVCRQLGYPSASQAWQHLVFGRAALPVFLDNVQCNGSESSIEQCNHSEWLKSADLCQYLDAGVTCDIKTPPPVPVRLANSSFPYEGRVELFYGGQWGVLVSKSWSIEMANIVCRQLGYPSALNAWPGGHFGSRVEPVLLKILSCQGNEESIDKCDHQGWFNTHGSVRGMFNGARFDLGVTCSQKSEVYPQVRLVNGTSPYEGRLEVYYKDQWGAVCNKGWSMLESSVICRQLQYPPATLAWQGAHFGQGQGRILLDNVTCIGNETSIDQCYYSDWSSDNCSHGEVVGVTCGEVSQALDLQNILSHVNSSQGVCGAVTSNATGFGILTWPTATAGEIVSSFERCPVSSLKAGSPRAVCECLATDPPRWGNCTYKSCGEVITDDEEESTLLIKEAGTSTTPVKKSLGFITQVSCVVSVAAFTITLVVNLIAWILWNTSGKAHHISGNLSLSVIAWS